MIQTIIVDGPLRRGQIRNSPRLIWPFAFSSLIAVFAFFPLPAATVDGLWLFTISLVVLWSGAIGTVIGGLLARAAVAGVRRIRSR
jgi:high-affinity K+ transport system ATPase subunit B